MDKNRTSKAKTIYDVNKNIIKIKVKTKFSNKVIDFVDDIVIAGIKC